MDVDVRLHRLVAVVACVVAVAIGLTGCAGGSFPDPSASSRTLPSVSQLEEARAVDARAHVSARILVCRRDVPRVEFSARDDDALAWQVQFSLDEGTTWEPTHPELIVVDESSSFNARLSEAGEEWSPDTILARLRAVYETDVVSEWLMVHPEVCGEPFPSEPCIAQFELAAAESRAGGASEDALVDTLYACETPFEWKTALMSAPEAFGMTQVEFVEATDMFDLLCRSYPYTEICMP